MAYLLFFSFGKNRSFLHSFHEIPPFRLEQMWHWSHQNLFWRSSPPKRISNTSDILFQTRGAGFASSCHSRTLKNGWNSYLHLKESNIFSSFFEFVLLIWQTENIKTRHHRTPDSSMVPLRSKRILPVETTTQGSVLTEQLRVKEKLLLCARKESVCGTRFQWENVRSSWLHH